MTSLRTFILLRNVRAHLSTDKAEGRVRERVFGYSKLLDEECLNAVANLVGLITLSWKRHTDIFSHGEKQ